MADSTAASATGFGGIEVKIEILSSSSKRTNESRQIGALTQTGVPSWILFLCTTAQIEQEIPPWFACCSHNAQTESSLELSSLYCTVNMYGFMFLTS